MSLVCLVLHLPAVLSGFSVRLTDEDPPTAERWADDHVTYRMQLAGSDDLPAADALGAVRAAFATWAALDCTTVTFEELGDAPDPSATLAVTSAPDGHNDVVWVEGDDWRFGAYVLGVTAPVIGADRALREADIAFNGLYVQWTTSGNGGTDLESVAVHEIGHFIGAQHNLGPYEHAAPPTMAPFVASGIQNRTLEPDDQKVACFLYPAAPYRCVSDADCPLLLSQTFESNDFYSGRFRCERAGAELGTCTRLERFLPDGVGFGERCHRPEECAAELGCHPYVGASGGDGGICTHGCDPFAAASCRDGYRCEAFPVPLETSGVCLPDDGVVLPPGEGPDGCLSTAICAPGKACLPLPGVDIQEGLRRCALVCAVADGDAGCPPGQGCWSYGQPNGACFDRVLFPVEPEPEVAPEASEPEPTPEPGPEPTSEPAPDTAVGPEPAPARPDDGCHGGATPLALGLIALGLRRRRERAP
ncbi:MAG: matrixin family metalloprotease [Deltaproteobacteria bacterium]|nr:matrixin family metalloprotease [Deltaproteobacteria bacterium]